MTSKLSYALCKRLAALIFLVLAPAPAFSGASVSVTRSLLSSHGGSVTFECVDVCAVPSAGGALPIPFPEITASVSNGELRGLVRVLGTETDKVRLSGQISYDTRGVAAPHPDSFAALVAGGAGAFVSSGLLGPAFVLHSGAILHFQGRGHYLTRVTAGLCSEGESGCSSAEATSFLFIQSGENHAVSPNLEAGSGADWDRRSASAEFSETASLSMPYSESFDIGWGFNFDVVADRNGSAELDFSSTLGFTGIRFEAANGFDMTPFMQVSFADGLQIPGMQVASPIPEPETYAMLLAGLGLLGWHAKRRKQKEAALA